MLPTLFVFCLALSVVFVGARRWLRRRRSPAWRLLRRVRLERAAHEEALLEWAEAVESGKTDIAQWYRNSLFLREHNGWRHRWGFPERGALEMQLLVDTARLNGETEAAPPVESVPRPRLRVVNDGPLGAA